MITLTVNKTFTMRIEIEKERKKIREILQKCATGSLTLLNEKWFDSKEKSIEISIQIVGHDWNQDNLSDSSIVYTFIIYVWCN